MAQRETHESQDLVDELVESAPHAGAVPFSRGIMAFFLCSLAFMSILAVRTFLIQPFSIPSSSMAPTLEAGERVLVSRVAYRFAEPTPGDIVVFSDPTEHEAPLIKRVIAIEGQTVDIQSGRVTVDGITIDEPYAEGLADDESTFVEPLVIPAGHVFVLGDNRTDSLDSRFYGPQPVSSIRGRAFAVYWPPSEATGL